MKVIHVLRKPCAEGTVAANVLRWGTGAVNVDASRVAHDAGVDMDAVQRQQATGGNSSVKGAFGAEALVGKEIAMYKPGGRWPANLILQHLDGCRCEGTKGVKPPTDREGPGPGHLGSRPCMSEGWPRGAGFAGGSVKADGTETVAAWACAEGCPVAALDEQSGVSKSKEIFGRGSNRASEGWGMGGGVQVRGPGDAGGASRFFKQIS